MELQTFPQKKKERKKKWLKSFLSFVFTTIFHFSLQQKKKFLILNAAKKFFVII
jgi:hypothetical protein